MHFVGLILWLEINQRSFVGPSTIHSTSAACAQGAGESAPRFAWDFILVFLSPPPRPVDLSTFLPAVFHIFPAAPFPPTSSRTLTSCPSPSAYPSASRLLYLSVLLPRRRRRQGLAEIANGAAALAAAAAEAGADIDQQDGGLVDDFDEDDGEEEEEQPGQNGEIRRGNAVFWAGLCGGLGGWMGGGWWKGG